MAIKIKPNAAQVAADWKSAHDSIIHTLAVIPNFVAKKEHGRRLNFQFAISMIQQDLASLEATRVIAQRMMDEFSRPICLGMNKEDLKTKAAGYSALALSGLQCCTTGTSLASAESKFGVADYSFVKAVNNFIPYAVFALGALAAYFLKKQNDAKNERDTLKTEVLDKVEFIESTRGVILLHTTAGEISPPRELERQATAAALSAAPASPEVQEAHHPANAKSAPNLHREVEELRYAEFAERFVQAIKLRFPNIARALPANADEIEQRLTEYDRRQSLSAPLPLRRLGSSRRGSGGNQRQEPEATQQTEPSLTNSSAQNAASSLQMLQHQDSVVLQSHSAAQSTAQEPASLVTIVVENSPASPLETLQHRDSGVRRNNASESQPLINNISV